MRMPSRAAGSTAQCCRKPASRPASDAQPAAAHLRTTIAVKPGRATRFMAEARSEQAWRPALS